MMDRDGWFAIDIRVRYAETDQMGVVYHANYVTWFEIARTEWTRAKGFPYKAMEERGLLLPVVDLTVQYKQPAFYDDEVVVRCRASRVSPVRISFEYEVCRKDDPRNILVTGTSEHAWVGADWKPVRLNKAAPDVYEALKRETQEGQRTS
jgi:acyl-CoA thioester hydrolase